MAQLWDSNQGGAVLFVLGLQEGISGSSGHMGRVNQHMGVFRLANVRLETHPVRTNAIPALTPSLI